MQVPTIPTRTALRCHERPYVIISDFALFCKSLSLWVKTLGAYVGNEFILLRTFLFSLSIKQIEREKYMFNKNKKEHQIEKLEQTIKEKKLNLLSKMVKKNRTSEKEMQDEYWEIRNLEYRLKCKKLNWMG